MQSTLRLLLIISLFSACQNKPVPPAPPAPVENGSLILSHKYWVSKPYNDALAAADIVDTLSYLPCSELIFSSKDSLWITSCLSDAGRGYFKATAPNILEITFEGFEGQSSTATYDVQTGVLHIIPPGGPDSAWPTEFVAQDGIDVSEPGNVTIDLARKRLAGNYSILAPKGGVAITSLVELHADGTQLGFGDFDTWEPWPTGIGSGLIQGAPRNLMYLIKKGKESEPDAAAWQVRGDTLRIWNTKNVAHDGDMPEYKITRLMGTYLKQK